MAKKKLKEKTKVIDLKPFPHQLKLVVTNDLLASEKKIRALYNDACTKPASNSTTGALAMHSRGTRTMYILMPYTCDIGYIAHEVWHIVRALLTFAGAALENEVVAYYIGWLTREAAVFNYTVSGQFDRAEARAKAKRAKLDKKPPVLVL